MDEWRESLSEKQIEEIAPKKGREDIMPQEVKLSLYFIENIWLEKQKVYLISNECRK